MLTPEMAQKVLIQNQTVHHETRHLAAIAQLPDDLRPSAYALMNHDETGQPIQAHYYGSWQTPADQANVLEKQNAALMLLEPMMSEQRQQIFTIFFPQISADIERGWNFAKQQAYQYGHMRRAFRAPTHPDISLWKRIVWLRDLVSRSAKFDRDIVWFAQYAAYMDYGWAAVSLSIVFAALIDSDDPRGQAVFDILIASAKGDHDIGMMGRHIARTLLMAARPEGWDFVEKLLLAAQREEGLRYTILETVDEAHPLAFQRMLRVIIENNMARFSAVTRALNVWVGFMWDSESVRVVNTALECLLNVIEDADARETALQTGSGEEVYLALWAIAFDDIFQAIPRAAALLQDANVERRFGALHLLAMVHLPEASNAMMPALHDDDVRMVAYTCQVFGDHWYSQPPSEENLFEEIEAILPRLSETGKDLGTLIWPWMTIQVRRGLAVNILLQGLKARSPKRLIPYMKMFDQNQRIAAVHQLSQIGLDDPQVRDIVLGLLSDLSESVREYGLKLMEDEDLRPADAVYMEGLLTRKANDLRRGVLSLLIKQPDEASLASVDRLTHSKKPLQRVAGLELLSLLVQNERVISEGQQRATAYHTAHPDAADVEIALIERILQEREQILTLDNCLGLINPQDRSPVIVPRPIDVTLATSAGLGILTALDALIAEHRHVPLNLPTWQGEQEVLLGNAHYHFPHPDKKTDLDDDIKRLPLAEIWQNWWAQRADDLRDDDGRELLRAYTLHSLYDTQRPRVYSQQLEGELAPLNDISYGAVISRLLMWLMRFYPPPNGADLMLDLLESTLAGVSKEQLQSSLETDPRRDWRFEHLSPQFELIGLVRNYQFWGMGWTQAHDVRYFQLLHWFDEPILGAERQRPQLRYVLQAYRAGAATTADLYDQLLGARGANVYSNHFHDLREISSKKESPFFAEHPGLKEVFETSRTRILEVELKRGETPTPVSAAALSLRSIHGITWFLRILQALGDETLARSSSYRSQSRSTVFSHLLQIAFPDHDETADDFMKALKSAKITQKRLIEAAVYAPQWASFIEQALQWEGFAEAVWWVHAHTKDSKWSVDADIRETWTAQVNERTPLSGEDLLAGGVDAQWFGRVYQTLGEKRWNSVYAAAKYSSGGRGHNRAKLFADAMLNTINQSALLQRITQKRDQDALRALGLLPLPQDNAQTEIQARYQVVQEFLRTGRKFGAQRQAAEKQAARINLENMARTAGYPDPLRLQWAMEAQAVADLRDGPLSVTHEAVVMTLNLDEVGKPHLSLTKEGKKIKTLSARLKKHPEFVELQTRKRDLDKQHSRMRHALEAAMMREDVFQVAELRDLLRHPGLAPMLEQLIFIGESVIGYLIDGGQALLHHDGTAQALPAEGTLKLAHTYDIFTMGEWHLWQKEAFRSERIQPFKQVFRELYLLTEAERLEGAISRRYAGHQVQPRQAMALLGARGWVAHPGAGVQRTFHQRKIAVSLTFLQGFYTPVDVEGMTLEGIIFAEPGVWWKPMQLADVPSIVFSEAMRDLDLVVSVAHRGGIDPETTASTVEMRAALLRETADLLKIQNISFQGRHALIAGQLGDYSVHLGSAIVHRQPGGALCIIPVHAQHRGRIFLPFVDDDPKTAEVISKALMLARDEQIKDSTILEQIFAQA